MSCLVCKIQSSVEAWENARTRDAGGGPRPGAGRPSEKETGRTWAAGKHVGRLLGAAKHVRSSGQSMSDVTPCANVVPTGGLAGSVWALRIPEGIRPGFHLQEPRRRNTSFTKKTGHRCRDAPRPSAIEVHTWAGADTLCSQVSQSQCGRCSPKPQRTGYSAACGSPGSAGRPCARVQPVPGEQSRSPIPVVRWDNSEASEMGAEGTHGGSTLLSAHFTDLSHFPTSCGCL